jgi:hypothetical protein
MSSRIGLDNQEVVMKAYRQFLIQSATIERWFIRSTEDGIVYHDIPDSKIYDHPSDCQAEIHRLNGLLTA